MVLISSSDRQPLLPSKRTFNIHPTLDSEAQAILSIEQHLVQHSPTSTRDKAATLEELRSAISACRHASTMGSNMIHLIAVLGSGAKASLPEATDYTVEDTEAPKAKALSLFPKPEIPYGALGYVLVTPWMINGSPPQPCYKHTALLIVSHLLDPVLDTSIQQGVISALIHSALARTRSSYKTIIHNIRIESGQPPQTPLYNVLKQHGFEQAGILKKVMEKRGIFYDLVYMQKEL